MGYRANGFELNHTYNAPGRITSVLVPICAFWRIKYIFRFCDNVFQLSGERPEQEEKLSRPLGRAHQEVHRMLQYHTGHGGQEEEELYPRSGSSTHTDYNRADKIYSRYRTVLWENDHCLETSVLSLSCSTVHGSLCFSNTPLPLLDTSPL